MKVSFEIDDPKEIKFLRDGWYFVKRKVDQEMYVVYISMWEDKEVLYLRRDGCGLISCSRLQHLKENYEVVSLANSMKIW